MSKKKKKLQDQNPTVDSALLHSEIEILEESPVVMNDDLDLLLTVEKDADSLDALFDELASDPSNDESTEALEDSLTALMASGSDDALETLEDTGEGGAADETSEDFLLQLTDANEEEKPVTNLTDDEAVSIIESLLFISDRPVGLTTFKSAFESTNIETKKIKELINDLKIDFVNARRGVTLEEVDGAYQLRTKPDNQDFIKKILKPKIFKLTGPSLETLSIIAYKQPCVKSQVDEIRGVESGHLIRALMDKGLVAFDGKSDFPGRPMLYKTTRKFLEIFGLRNLSELPSLSEMEEILTEGIGDEDEDKPTLSQLAGSLEESFEAQSYSIGEEELGKITEQLSGISTQTEFFEVEKQKQRESRDRDRAEGLREALILGDAIDPKDEKWLQRYDIKMNQVLEDNVIDLDAETDTDAASAEVQAVAASNSEDTQAEGSELEASEALADVDRMSAADSDESVNDEQDIQDSDSDFDTETTFNLKSSDEPKKKKKSEKNKEESSDLDDLLSEDPLDLL